MDERMARMEELLAQLAEQVAINRQARRGNLGDRDEQEEKYEDRGLKIEIPDFDGTSGDPETYIEWEKALERYFEYKDTPEDRKYKLAKMKLTRSAGVWFEGLQKQRTREERARITTWDKLKKYLRRKYVPSNYKQTLYIRMSSLKQDKKGVHDYIREFEKLLIDCDVSEPEEMKLGRFVGGLNKDLRDKLEAYPNLSYDEACSLASVFEKQRRSAYSYEAPLKDDGQRKAWRRSPTPHPNKTSMGSSSSSLNKVRETEKGEAKEILCYRCNGFGHMQRDCPNKKAFTIREWKDIRASKKVMLVETEEGGKDLYAEGEDGDFAPYMEEPETVGSEDNSSDGEELPPETRSVLMTRKNFVSISKEQHEQRENLFQTTCRVKNEFCDVIIDSGSQANCVDKRLVEKLGLATTPHPTQYCLKWLDDKSGQRVRKQCRVPIRVGSYEDEVLCDVLKMEACHILLGRPWQHDKRVKYDGYKNIYSFRDKGKKKALLPLPPQKGRKGIVSLFVSQGKEVDGNQGIESGKDTPRVGVRSFEVFETLFDPPKFVPEFMKEEVTVNKGVDLEIDFEVFEGLKASGLGSFLDKTVECNGHYFKKVREGEKGACGSCATFGIALSKIRGRIFPKKGGMHQVKVRGRVWVGDGLKRRLVRGFETLGT